MSDWDAIYFFARRIGERKAERARLGSPPEPVPTREEVIRKMQDALMQPNALIARLGVKK